MTSKLTIADYPLAETRSAEIRGQRGKSLDDITLEAVIAGDVTMEDLRITPKALADQAEISRAAKRPTLALNFERAGELVDVPQDFIMSVRTTFDKFAQSGESPVLLTSPLIRPYVRSVIERFRPSTVVMSQNEIHPKARIKTLGQV